MDSGVLGLILFSEPPFPEETITGRFGQVYTGANGVPYYHRGVDFSTPVGEPVVFTGHEPAVVRVSRSYDDGSFGLHVRLELVDGSFCVYAHLSRVDVALGALVRPGDVLGLSGNSGMSTGPHLHWQVSLSLWMPSTLVGNTDPMELIGMPKKPASSLQSEDLNDLYVMGRDIARLTAAPWAGFGLPELHKLLREHPDVPHDFEYQSDYEGMINA